MVAGRGEIGYLDRLALLGGFRKDVGTAIDGKMRALGGFVDAARFHQCEPAPGCVVAIDQDRIGVSDLERTRGNVQLTPAGEILYQVSKEIVQRYQEMEGRLQALAQIVAGTVRVATVHSISGSIALVMARSAPRASC